MSIGDRGSDAPAGGVAPDKVSFLDQALWRRLNEAADMAAFADAWLTLLCRVIEGVRSGFVALGPPDSGQFAPVAGWPAGSSPDQALSDASEAALVERRGVVQGRRTDSESGAVEGACLAFPFLIDGRLYGVVALEVEATTPQALRTIMRLVQWSAAWIELSLRKDHQRQQDDLRQRASAALDLLAAVLDEERFRAACTAVVTELALRLNCDRVSIGFVKRGRAQVVTMSHSASFGKRMNLIRQIGSAMDEAIDQRTSLLYPLQDPATLIVTQAHAELARGHGAGVVLTVPMNVHDEYIGAVCMERPASQPFDPTTIGIAETVVAMLGPALDEKRRNDRWVFWKLGESLWRQLQRLLGPSYVGRKLIAAGVIAVVCFAYFATGEYRVTGTARIEGQLRRVVVASFDGYIASADVRAGDNVKKGQLLATLDDKDLVLERLKWVTTRQQRRREHEKALAERDPVAANIAKVQIEQAEAQISLIDEELARTKLTAPLDGLVVTGDLSDSIGGAVKRGEVLFEITPLTGYRVIMQVDESQIGEIAPGQRGQLLVSSVPDDAFAFTVRKIVPVAEPKEGHNTFRVEAALDASSPRLRPAMEGIGKIDVARRRLVWIWTRSFVNRARLWLWRWLP